LRNIMLLKIHYVAQLCQAVCSGAERRTNATAVIRATRRSVGQCVSDRPSDVKEKIGVGAILG
jgi:hypothetical protein